jgi:hypothetical protein
MEQLGHVSAIVEIEFYGELGTGLGPTLEFYSLLALELQAVSLSMWRCPAIVSRAELFPDGKCLLWNCVLLFGPHSTIEGLGQAPGFGSELDGGVDDAVSYEFVSSPRGLFPIPTIQNSADCVTASNNFLFLGKVLARCIVDGRLLDLPLSPLVFKVSPLPHFSSTP